jgi:UDP-GlcNAc3NAcA epimerase
MRPLRIVSVVGARPQFIKAAVVSRAMAEANRADDKLHEILVHTGQHYDDNMSDVFFRELEIPAPAYHLEVGSAGHGRMTGLMLERIEQVLLQEGPDLVLVYGDTNSTLAGALAAVKLHISVAHVEAGLRSFNMRMPEEINRVVTDRISQWLFCPTELAKRNLLQEGTDPTRTCPVGDVMYDAVLHYAEKAQLRPESAAALGGGERYCVATVHRAENTDDPGRLRGILEALDRISGSTPVILPLHPRTQARLGQWGLTPGRVRLIAPVGYLEMIALLRHCEGVLTDSGGLQKEAFFLRKPCVTLRTETEWQELVDLGVNVVAGADAGRITAAWSALQQRACRWDATPYGRGDAGAKIVATLLAWREGSGHVDSRGARLG